MSKLINVITSVVNSTLSIFKYIRLNYIETVFVLFGNMQLSAVAVQVLGYTAPHLVLKCYLSHVQTCLLHLDIKHFSLCESMGYVSF